MRETYDARDSRPVMTAAGIMPGGSEMTNWYDHIPFPSPSVLAIKRVELLALIAAQKAALEQATTPLRPALQVLAGGDERVLDRAS